MIVCLHYVSRFFVALKHHFPYILFVFSIFFGCISHFSIEESPNFTRGWILAGLGSTRLLFSGQCFCEVAALWILHRFFWGGKMWRIPKTIRSWLDLRGGYFEEKLGPHAYWRWQFCWKHLGGEWNCKTFATIRKKVYRPRDLKNEWTMVTYFVKRKNISSRNHESFRKTRIPLRQPTSCVG